MKLDRTLRFTQAELLFEQGRLDEALRWYRTMMDVTPFEAVYLPMAHLRQGQIHEARGDMAAARQHYQAFVVQWRDADPALQPLVADAIARLSASAEERD